MSRSARWSTHSRPPSRARRSCTPRSPNNICFKWTVAGGDAEAAFQAADVVVKERIINQRLIPTAMEPRAAWRSTRRR